MKLCSLVLVFVSIQLFAQGPGNTVRQNPQPRTQLEDNELQSRAWFAERRKEHPDLKQVAEGKYLYTDPDTTPAPSSSYDAWTLWKSPDGEFEVSGALEFPDESVPYWIKLTPRMRPTAFKFFRMDQTSIACRRTPSELRCEQTNDAGKVLRTANDAINDTTEIFMPITFFWAGQTRGAEFHGDAAIRLTFLAQGGETETFPVSFSPIGASLRVLRRGKYPILHSEIDAAEFQLDMQDPSERPANPPHAPGAPPGSAPQQPLSPVLKLWVSAKGILLSASPTDPEEGNVRLVEFKKLAEF